MFYIMKLEKLNLNDAKIEKSKMAAIKDGTTTTVMIEHGGCGYSEMEYPDDGTGCPDWDAEPTLVVFG